MNKICPRCGRKSGEVRFVGNFCEECHAAGLRVEIPDSVSIPVCRSCGRMKFGTWQEKTQRALQKAVEREIKGDYERATMDFYTDSCELTVFSGGGSLARRIRIESVPQLCDDCGRRSGGYFEAIVQLRGDGEKIRKAQDKLVARIGERSFVSKTKALKEGVDLYVGSRKAALDALHEMRLQYSTSAKLFGMKDGRRLYRFTYCTRL